MAGVNILSVSELTKRYSDAAVINRVSFGFDKGERLGLIGRNGSGKTTLLRIIAGIEDSEHGTVVVNRNCRIQYLSQLPDLDVSMSALTTVASAWDTARNGDIEAWDLEVRSLKILGRMGITDALRHVGAMSGGERKRVALAATLLGTPDILLLDEPTNHLDADTIQSLQDLLRNSPMSLLFVTHDRYFLDAVATRIVELEEGNLWHYEGNYEEYLIKKEERRALRDATNVHLRNTLRRELAWLGKGAKARRTKQKSRIDWIEDLIDTAGDVAPTERNIEIELGNRNLGGRILEVVDVQISASDGSPTLVEKHTWRAKPGDRIGIIGPNGCGKSTLLDVMAGLRPPQQGYVTLGEMTHIGYYKQDDSSLETSNTVLGNVRAIAEYIDVGIGRDRYISARELCRRFGFADRMQHAFVHTLSGGERKRLSLLRLLMANPNVIFLDEPTNDFDLQTLSALEEYLDDFRGVLVVVSHDRAFLDRTINTLWKFHEGGRIREYPGNYSAYLEKIEISESPSADIKVARSVSPPTGGKPTTRKGLSFAERKELSQLESAIESLDNQKRELEALLSVPDADYRKTEEMGLQLLTIMAQLQEMEQRWSDLFEKDSRG